MIANLRSTSPTGSTARGFRRLPPVTLTQRRVYIVPTRQGYTFALTVFILLIASINYALALGFVLTFTLVSMASVAMLHTWRNLAHLTLRPGRSDAIFAGETAHVGITVETPSTTRFFRGGAPGAVKRPSTPTCFTIR